MELKPLHQDLRLADFVTLLNAVAGFLSIGAAAAGDYYLAGAFILLGILLDGLDGAVARLGGGGSPLGATLDALSDVVTFAVAPAILILQAGDTAWPALIVGAFLLSAVLLRLARFEVLRKADNPAFFYGISSPGGAILVAATVMLGLPILYTLVAAVAASLLMLSRMRYPKLRGWLGVVAVLLIGASLVTVVTDVLGQAPLLAMVGFMVFYILAGPMYVQRQERS